MSELRVKARQLKDGTTVYEYSFEIAPVNGKRKSKSKSGFKTKKEAREAGKKAQDEYEKTGKTISSKGEISYADYLDYWIKEDVAKTLKDNTVKNYQKKIRLYIKPVLGSMRLKTITRQDIRNFQDDMYNKGFSRNTISVCKGIITKSFNFAVDTELLTHSPAAGIKGPKKGGRPPEKPTRTKQHVYIPEDKMNEIFIRFPEGTSDYTPIMFGYHCGMRLGEAFAPVWEDIDFQNKKLKLNRQIQWMSNSNRTENEKKMSNGTNEAGGGYWYFAEPKYASYRIIDLDDEMIDYLLRLKEQQEKAEAYYGKHYKRYYAQYPLQFTGEKPDSQPPINPIDTKGNVEIHFINIREDGSYITPRTMQHTSSVIHKALNFPEFDFHSLRHTHSTMLAESGAPLVYIQKRLGHEKPEMTTQVYTNHLTPKIITMGNNILNSMF